MADFSSRQKTLGTGTPKTKLNPTEDGKVRFAVATTPAVAAWAQNDTFGTGIIIPKGARLLRLGRVLHGVFGASVTMDVGLRNPTTLVAIDQDGLAVALSVAAAGVKELTLGAVMTGTAILTEDAEVYATLLAANPTDDAQAEFEIYWAPSV